MAVLENFFPVLLAGGSGTRFWPRSRRARAKQVLALHGEQTMIQQAVERLLPLAPPENFWVVTNDLLSDTLRDQLSAIPEQQMLREPAARNTAPAAALAAFLIERIAPEAVVGMFPSDHVIGDEAEFRRTIREGVALARQDGVIVTLGVTPTRPEVGYGYIETGSAPRPGVTRVRRFTEKPNLIRAEAMVAAGNFVWNSGMFLWRASTLANAIREHLSETAPLLEKIAAAWDTPVFPETFRELYPQCENISIDYAVLEPRSTKGEHHSKIYCLAADFAWNDLGSWEALFEQHSQGAAGNIVESDGSYAWKAERNYVFSPKRFVALVGVDDLVVVDTDDALLVCSREHSQEVGRVVRHLNGAGRHDLL